MKNESQSTRCERFRRIQEFGASAIVEINRTCLIADLTHDQFFAWLHAASPNERAAAVQEIMNSPLPSARLKFTCSGSKFAMLDDVVLPSARLDGVNLSGAKLRRADLRRVELTDAVLAGASLGNARLRKAVLVKTDFRDAELATADLSFADLSKANLSRALCEETRFTAAKLRFADLSTAACEQAMFTRADLWGANLTDTNCSRADFRHAVFKEATAIRADMSGAVFRGADLSRTDFHDANLSDADFRMATIAGADFRGANLRHARLDGLDLTSVKLEGTRLAGARLDGARLERRQFGDRLGDERAGDVEAARGGYLALERVFTSLGDSSAARWAYCRRRRMEKRLSWRTARLRWRQRSLWASLKSALTAAGDQCVEWTCDYGESIGRVLLTIGFVFFGFAVLYGLTDSVVRVERSPNGAETRISTSNPFDLAVFSLLALTTSGSPAVAVQPRDQFVHFLTGIQALFGIASTGLLGFVAGNRIRR